MRWILFFLASSVGCHPLDEFEVEGLRWLSGEIRTSKDGHKEVRIPVEEADGAMLITLESMPGQLVHAHHLYHPTGATLFDAEVEAREVRSTTSAGFLDSTVTLNWPPLPYTPWLESGDWWIDVGVTDLQGNYERGEVWVDVLLKPVTPEGGVLPVTMVYAGDAIDDEDLLEGTRAAVEAWRDMYANVGIELEVIEATYPNADLEPPGYGSPEDYRSISQGSGVGRVNVVVVPALLSEADVYGIAGDIPAPLVTSTDSAVLVSGELARGTDGLFSEEELRLYSETLAHEVGHLLGLFHPVEADFSLWDALEDTEDCEREGACESAMGDNLMFPYPVCSLTECVPQGVLTMDQGGVLQRYVGVR